MIDIKRPGPPSGPGSEISHQQATDHGESTAPHRQGTAPVPFVYGVDHPDTDLWVDRNGRVHCGDGPYLNRPLRRLRRAVRRWRR